MTVDLNLAVYLMVHLEANQKLSQLVSRDVVMTRWPLHLGHNLQCLLLQFLASHTTREYWNSSNTRYVLYSNSCHVSPETIWNFLYGERSFLAVFESIG